MDKKVQGPLNTPLQVSAARIFVRHSPARSFITPGRPEADRRPGWRNLQSGLPAVCRKPSVRRSTPVVLPSRAHHLHYSIITHPWFQLA